MSGYLWNRSESVRFQEHMRRVNWHKVALRREAGKLGLTIEEVLDKRGQGLKHCGVCKEWKSTRRFSSDRSRWDGLCPICTICNRERCNQRKSNQ